MNLVVCSSYFADGRIAYALQIFRVFENELRFPKRMLHPRATKSMDVHAENEVFDTDFFEHVRIFGWIAKQRAQRYKSQIEAQKKASRHAILGRAQYCMPGCSHLHHRLNHNAAKRREIICKKAVLLQKHTLSQRCFQAKHPV